MGARESELRVCLRNGFVGFGSRVESSVRYASCGSKKGRVGRSARNDRKTHSQNSRMQPDQIFRPFETDSQRRATADARFGSREEFPIKTIQIRSNIQSHQSINQSVSQSVGRAKNLLPFLRDSQSVHWVRSSKSSEYVVSNWSLSLTRDFLSTPSSNIRNSTITL